ncbi:MULTISPECIES: hypothetical protein [Bacillus]|jgi:riboflavin kinase|nr:hypothetical protein [Bacillus smithii]AKP46524.1 Riboflavin kinase [Bacillus smithii]MED4884672.1 hypothetical protein [Bacillus smithii]MED4928314.1 hypothetical protein [Bacillus smithii]
MPNNNLIYWEPPVRKEKKNSLRENKYLNMPDLSFFHWCHQQYGINRGVYNTIDHWFYEHGLEEIISRRIYILAFLKFVRETENGSGQHKFIRFGNGGLTKKLIEFFHTK